MAGEDNQEQSRGESIVEREAKLTPVQEETVRIVEKGDKDDDQDDLDNGKTDDGSGDEDESGSDEDPRANLANQSVPTVADPGEFKPADYSFEVQEYNEDGKPTKTHKVKSIEDWDELLAKDPNLGSAAALLKAQRLATKMESAQERDKSQWQDQKDKFDEEKKQLDAQAASMKMMVSEVDYLVTKGKLPKIDKQYVNADWSDAEVAKQPGVKEQLALLSYMKKENNARVKAGLSPITSILDGFNAWKNDDNEVTAVKAKKQAGEARKQAGSRVSGASSAPRQVAPPGLMVGRGGSLRDLGNMV